MPTVIGIAGGSASGKSTFADALAHAIVDRSSTTRVDIVSTDKYARPNDPDAPTFTSPSSGETAFDWNHPDSVDNARLAADIAASTADVLIVEGLMVLHVPEIRRLLDIRLFVDLDADIRALRRMLRNMTVRGQDPAFIDAYYRECARIGHARYVEPSRQYADLILRGDSDFNRTAAMIAKIVVQ